MFIIMKFYQNNKKNNENENEHTFYKNKKINI